LLFIRKSIRDEVTTVYEETTNSQTVNFSGFDFNCNLGDLFLNFASNLALIKRNSLLSQTDRRPDDNIINVIFRDRIFTKKIRNFF
jgi:hypothetical protein